MLDTNEYNFKVTKDNLIANLTLKEKVTERKVVIHKKYGINEKNVKAEDNVKFNIYLKSTGKYYSSIITDDTGTADIVLPYGTWIFKQVNSKNNYDLAPDFEVQVKDDDNTDIEINLFDKLISAKVKVTKVDKDTEKTILLDNIRFKIRNTDTDKYLCIEDNICEFKTTNGEFATSIPLTFGNYALEEVKDQEVEGYLINKEALYFSIDENSEFFYDVDGPYIKLKFANKKAPIISDNIDGITEHASINIADDDIRDIKQEIILVPNTGKYTLDYNNLVKICLLIFSVEAMIYEKKHI